jgi:thioesterase domain-containing protein
VAAFLAGYPEEERRTLGWCRYPVGRIDVVDVPGAHVTLGSEPHVRVLAGALRQALAAAHQRAPGAEAAR